LRGKGALSFWLATVRRSRFIFAAWLVGWLVYMIGMVLTVYDGILSLIFQPIMAALVSGMCVGLCFMVGLVFKIPVVGKVWGASRFTAMTLATLSVFLMIFGSTFGFTQTFTDPESGAKIVGLHSGLAVACYWALLFSLVNFPITPKNVSQ
jgi:hypothetical protein